MMGEPYNFVIPAKAGITGNVNTAEQSAKVLFVKFFTLTLTLPLRGREFYVVGEYGSNPGH